jgi:hypothetical protein
VFIGRESSIAMSRSPSRLVQQDWIIITGPFKGRQIQIAITKKEGLQEIWQALAEAGARRVTGLAPDGSAPPGRQHSGRSAGRRTQAAWARRSRDLRVHSLQRNDQFIRATSGGVPSPGVFSPIRRYCLTCGN